jgi:DNA polymerase-3 subunit alpha
MPHAEFVHLRVHSAYSLSESAIKIDELVELCRRHEMPAVAVTDTGNLFGALEFSLACTDAGIQPIIGCQLAIRGVSEEVAEDGHPAEATADVAHGPMDQIVLLAQNDVGYTNLLKLVSRSFLETEGAEAPHVTVADLAGHGAGLIALTGGPAGPVGRPLGEGGLLGAEAALMQLADLFPGRLYVEVTRHGTAVEARIEEPLIELAYKHHLPLVATNEAFFAEAQMYEAHDALLCIAGGTYVAEAERRRVTPHHRFKSAAEMRELFADLPEAVDNTLAVARRCTYMPRPREPMLPAFPTTGGVSEADELRRQASAGLEVHLARHVFGDTMDAGDRELAARPYRERFDFELGTITDMGFAGYFLIVADFIQWARNAGIPVGPGRGSGAGSVVAWSLTITDLDPLRFGLLFERFLNPERVSMPDFDIDFCQDRRDEVIAYVQEKYGRDRVAQIITFGTLQARAALRDVGRVLQMPDGQVDRICKMVPNNPANPVPLGRAVEGEPALQRMRDEDPTVARLIDIALKLEGLYRHASTHAAGVVIGDQPLDEIVPLYRDPRSEMAVTQFSMKWAEKAGLVKFDFLGLKTLTVLDRAEALLATRGIEVDLSNLPLDDGPTYEMMGRAEVTGVFQLESSGMRDVLRRLRPDRFEDIIALVALYRPGPMDNIPRFIACRHGEEEPDYLHASLEETLKETAGVMIYQEQVMQIAQVLSGYTLGGADLLRRAMGKKIKSEMEAQRKAFIDGAVARSVDKGKASLIFEQVNKFAGYGFNKSHAAAYAMVAYQTAYLKANHPVEFLAASMTLDMGNTDKLSIFRQELDRLGIPLRSPDINHSGADFSVERDEAEAGPEGGTPSGAIRYALAAVKNVGRAAMDALVAERAAQGPFRDLFEVARRLDSRVVNKRQLESLVCAGAFDTLSPNRAQTFAAVETMVRYAHLASSERESQQQSLFGGDDPGSAPAFALPDVPDWPVADRLAHEFAAVGFYLSAHPLDAYGKTLARLDVVSSADLPGKLNGGALRVKLAGTMLGKQERTSARGNRFAFVQLSDASGIFEVVMFSETLAAARELLELGTALLIVAEARLEDDAPRITAQQVQALDAAAAGADTSLKVYVDAVAPIASLRGIMERERRGRGHIVLIVPLAEGREAEVTLPGRFAITPPTRAAIKAIPGIVDVRES